MVWRIASFELRKRLATLSSYVYFLVFFACGALTGLIAGGAFAGLSEGAGAEKIFANAPAAVSSAINGFSNIGVLMSAAVFGQAVHQDFESGTSHFFFTLPIKRTSYLTGRFLGALVFVLVVFAAIGLGLLVVSVLPIFVNRALFGPFRLATFLWPYVTLVVPNAILTGGIFFALGTLGRKMMPVYTGAVVLAFGYLLAKVLLQDLDNRDLGALLDPFGSSAAAAVTRYWTPAEKNTLLVPLGGLLLANRAIWVSVGLAALGLTYARFSPVAESTPDRARAKGQLDAPPPIAGALPSANPHRTAGELARLLAQTTWLELSETVKSVYFGVFVLCGGILALIVAHFGTRLFTAPIWPLTSVIATLTAGGFGLFILIIITVYAGEIVWRERDLRFDQIVDALPVPTWLPTVAKLLALCLTPAVVLAAVPVFGIAYQTFCGYHHYELGLYLKLLYGFTLPNYILLCVLAFTAQSVFRHKYVGHFAMVAFYVIQPLQSKLGLEHNLLHYAAIPEPTYSDMNGFGHFARPFASYVVYWGGWALLLAVLASLFWTRGTEPSWRGRLRVARSRFRGGTVAFAALGLLAASAMGCAIYYQSDVLNRYRTSHQEEALQADYEKKYKSAAQSPQPRITDVKVDFDVYPADETLDAHGSYQLENKSGVPIESVLVELPPDQAYRTLSVAGVARPAQADPALGVYFFALPTPLPPGARAALQFDIRFHDPGFKEDGNRTDLCENGTFFNNGSLPHLGYDRNRELSLDNDRKKYGLPPRDRLPDLRDAKGLENSLIANDADWITFESTVSTSPDQIAVVPGYLEKEWTENGRRYFHYKMDSKMLDFYSRSCRPATQSGTTYGRTPTPPPAGRREVNLDISSHPGHADDLDEMMRGLKDTLTYDSAAFGPYQHRQARILEFPRYRMFAQSFPNTIPWSEGTGFITQVDLSKEGDVDLPYYGAGHELSHQWWAHQVIGGNVQGSPCSTRRSQSTPRSWS